MLGQHMLGYTHTEGTLISASAEHHCGFCHFKHSNKPDICNRNKTEVGESGIKRTNMLHLIILRPAIVAVRRKATMRRQSLTSEQISINKIQPNSKPKWSSTTSRKTEQNRRKHLIQKTGRERDRETETEERWE